MIENENSEMTAKKVEKGDVIQAPQWCKFQIDEVIPLKGWNFKCIGYTPIFEPVFKCIGPTSKTKESMSHQKLVETMELIRGLNSTPRPEAKPVDA